MTIPGFTAEASIYKTSERYHMVRTPGVVADRGEVVPQYCYSPRPGTFCCYSPWFGWTCRHLFTLA